MVGWNATLLASHALHREGPNPFIALRGEATLDEVNDLLRRLGPCARSTPGPGDAAKACETLLAIVDRAVADLTARADECEQRAASEEARRAGELAFDASPIGLNFARHERSLKSTLKVGVASLKRE